MENKESFILKIKNTRKKKMAFRKRVINSSILKDYDKIYKEIIDEIISKEDEGEKTLKDSLPIIIISHPEIKDIFIFSKEQWDLYYNYNIIEKCKSNRSLRIEYYLIDKTKPIDENIEEKIKECKKLIINYIIKNIPCDLLFNILIKFLEKNKDFAEQFKEYMTTDLINNYKRDKKDNNENLDENNIDKKCEAYKNLDYQGLLRIYKSYYFDNKEFINSLNSRFNKISNNYKYQKSINEIKNILNEDEEKNKKDNEQNKKDIEHKRFNTQSSLDLNAGNILDNLAYNNSSVIIDNDHVLQSALNPPSKYVSKLMENENFFKKFKTEEYYKGIEDYIDQLNRESYQMLIKNN